MAAGSPSRHINFHRLIESIAQPGCPVCRIAAEASERWFASLFREQVNDVGIRRRLVRSEGFCSRHTGQALETGDALGMAIIYAHLLRETLPHLNDRPREACPACEYESLTVSLALGALVDRITDADVEAAYRASEGLCLAHLRQALRLHNPEGAKILQHIEQQKLSRLAEQCELFVSKSRYERCSEPVGRERDAWRRAARKLGGGRNGGPEL